jgi:phytoene dehydrogenase-like protein
MKEIDRRDFLKQALALPLLMKVDWERMPRADTAGPAGRDYDAVVIGSGLGGLSCAAAFARQGFKVIVLEQHTQPGGFATAFSRKGGFVFDVSLHSTNAGEREGIRNLINGFPEIREVEFAAHPNLYRVIFPNHDIRVPQQDVDGYIGMLKREFPEEKDGIAGLFQDMNGLVRDIGAYSRARGQVDTSRFPQEYPVLFKTFNKTWSGFMEPWIKDPKLKAVLSAQWGYYGLPPSKLASFYYVLPYMGYLAQGGFYPKGRSRAISQAFVKFIEAKGGKVSCSTRVDKILIEEGAAVGVLTDKGKRITARAVVSNGSPLEMFNRMIDDKSALASYLERLEKLSVSLSSFQVFLGLNKDLVKEAGLKDSEVFIETGYDPEAAYDAAVAAKIEDQGFALTAYDNIYEGYSPQGKNTLNLLTLQGFDHWKPFEADYLKGNKTEYKKEKERVADILIDRAEKALLPGLRKAIEIKEIGTPLTNIRYTGHPRGAIYGWDQTLDNTGPRRLPHSTPVKNLYLAGAWTSPGHGYGAVIPSGLECFAEITRNWA